jgi:hypothetical protein
MLARLILTGVGLLACLAPLTQGALSNAEMEARTAKLSNNIHELTSASYEEILEGPRDYAVILVMTAMGDNFKCKPCKYV